MYGVLAFAVFLYFVTGIMFCARFESLCQLQTGMWGPMKTWGLRDTRGDVNPATNRALDIQDLCPRYNVLSAV